MPVIKQIEASKLIFSSSELEFAAIKNKDGDEAVDRMSVKLVVRTNTPVNTWFGNIIHDHSGMFSKKKVPLDWVHDAPLVGFLDKFEISNKEIVCRGEIVSVEEGDQASTIIKQTKAGIPFESSIYYGGQGLEMEEIAEDKSVTVNGKKFHGPGMVMRKWPLRGVAICPYGADNKTSVNALSEKVVSVLFLNGDNEMADNNDANKKADELKLKEEKLKLKLKEAEDKKLKDNLEKKKKADAESTQMKSSDGFTGQAFIEAYGSNGGVWFAEGKSFAEAGTLYIRKLQDRVDGLEKKLNSLDLGGDEEVEFNDDEDDPDVLARREKVADLSGKIGPGLAAFASSIKMPK